MHKGFLEKLKKPAIVIAPMADVTDAAFRLMFAKYGKPDITWTEFVSADGLLSRGFERLKKDLIYHESERPIIAQIFTAKPDVMHRATKLISELGFDGIDINMGCPAHEVVAQGCGSALIKTPKLARELIRAAWDGVRESGRMIPVSVKTRSGYKKDDLENWLPELLAEKPAILTLHARTREDMSKVPARWELLKQAVAIRDKVSPETLIFGNGDVTTLQDAFTKAKETGADGVMIGRGIFGAPWKFTDLDKKRDAFLRGEAITEYEPTIPERLNLLVEHTKLFEELLKGHKSFAVMKKHFKAYVNGFDGAFDLRAKLMETNSAAEVENIVTEFLKGV